MDSQMTLLTTYHLISQVELHLAMRYPRLFRENRFTTLSISQTYKLLYLINIISS